MHPFKKKYLQAKNDVEVDLHWAWADLAFCCICTSTPHEGKFQINLNYSGQTIATWPIKTIREGRSKGGGGRKGGIRLGRRKQVEETRGGGGSICNMHSVPCMQARGGGYSYESKSIWEGQSCTYVYSYITTKMGAPCIIIHWCEYTSLWVYYRHT